MASRDILLSRRKVLQVSLEADKGTLVAGATHVLAFDPVMQFNDATQTRQPTGAALGHFPAAPGERVGTCNFRAEMRSDGSAGWDIGLEICLQACGFAQAGDVIPPANTLATMKTITIGLHEDGLYKQLHGCMGNVRLTGEFGKQLFLEFEFSGVWNAPTDVAVPSATITAVKAMRLETVVWTIDDGAHTPLISNFTIDMGNSVTPVEDISQAEGVLYYAITDRDPVFTCDSLAELVATYDAFGKVLTADESALSMVFGDGTDDLTLAAPKLQHRAPQEADRDGKLSNEYTAQLNVSAHNAGGDELSLTVAAI